MQLTREKQKALERVLREKEGGKYYIFYLIYNNKLKEAKERYEEYIRPSGNGLVINPDSAIELLLAGRNNAMPTDFKFMVDGKTIENKYRYGDSHLCNLAENP